MQRKRYLNLFSSSSKCLISKYCRQIEECDADCFVVVARKAVCFIESLVQEGLLDRSIRDKQLYSSSCLDFMSNSFSGKKVAVIDDISNSGAAIAEIVNTLIDRFNVEPAKIEIIVLAVNLDTFSMDFTDHDTKHPLLDYNHINRLKSADCAELSKTIAVALCSVGIPYDSDFPTYETITITDQQCHQLLSPLFWICYDVSNQYHKASGINAITLLPKDSTIAEISTLMGMDLHDWVHLKIRILLTRSEMDTWELRVVPMAIIKETYITNVSQICNSIVGLNANTTGKFRFLQFYIAAAVGQTFWNKETTLSTPRLDATCCVRLFGPTGNELSPEFFENHLNSKEQFEGIERISPSISPIINNTSSNTQSNPPAPDSLVNFTLNEKLSEPITSWFINEEQPIREEIRQLRINYHEYNKCDGNPFKRLNRGFPFNHFYAALKDFRNSYHISSLVSIFLDRSIDLGFIVPTIFENGNTIYRAFRHGEGSQGIDSDLTYLKNFIILFKDYLRTKDPNFKEISSIAFEKIVVLFYKFASQEGLINNFMKFDNGCFLVEQHALHGAIIANQMFPELVSTDFTLHPYSEDDSYTVWLSKKLIQEGYVSVYDPDSGPYEINDVSLPTTPVTQANLGKIKMFAILFAEWYSTYNQSKANHDFRNSVIKLTSCESLDSISTSILAEIQYCIRNWQGDIAKAKEQSFEALIDYLQKILQSKSFTGINSGIQKFKFYTLHDKDAPATLDGRFVMKSTISEIEDKLLSVAPIYSAFWDQLWGDYLSGEPKRNEKLEKLLTKSVNYLYCFAVLYRSLHLVAIDVTDTTEIQYLLEQNNETLFGLENSIGTRLYEHCGEIIDSAAKQEEKVDMLMSLFEKVVVKAKEHRDAVEVELSLGVYDHAEKFNGCVVINFYCNDSALCKSILHDVISERTRYNELLAVEEQFVVNETWNSRKLLRFYLFANSEDNLSTLLQATDKIYQHIRTYGINCSFVLIPKFPEDTEYIYQVNTNTELANRLLRRTIIQKIDDALKDFYYGIVLVSPCALVSKNIECFERADIRKSLGHTITKEFTIEDIRLNGSEDYTMDIITTEIKKIGIITIRDDETHAVVEQFNMKPQMKGNYNYYLGEDFRDKILYQFYLRRQLDKGNVHAGDAAKQLVEDWDVDYVALLGVAGALKPDEVGICDVVVADKIVDATYGAETDTGYTPQTSMPEIDVQLVERIHNFQTQIFGRNFPNSDNLPEGKSTFKVVVAPIGNSGHVIKSDHAESRELIQKYINSSVVAVDTESAGVGASLRNIRLSGKAIMGPLIIRGISDGANVEKSKKDAYHFTAAKNAAAILSEILPYIV